MKQHNGEHMEMDLGGIMTKKTWKDVDNTILKSLPSPDGHRPYELKMKQPELTFMGVHEQPDFATLYVLMYPNSKIVELKSLKIYLQQYRDIIISYERLINVIFHDMMSIYEPVRLRLVSHCNPRGGIMSRTTIDSDWEALGGEEKYSSWGEDVW